MTLLIARFVTPALKLWGTRRIQAVLSMLGIVAGITGLMIVIALGEGANRELETTMGTLGAGTVIVRNTAEHPRDNLLTERKAAAIRRLAGPALQQMMPLRRSQLAVLAERATLQDVRVIGVGRQYREIYRIDNINGRFISDYDVTSGQRVCVLGWEAGKSLFPRGQVVGQQVRIGSDWYKVVGWLSASTVNLPQLESMEVDEIDRLIYLPSGAPAFETEHNNYDELLLQFTNEARMMQWLGVVRRVITRDQPEAAVEYVIPIQLLRHKHRMQQVFQYLLFGIAAIMLLVGGVGVMNIMLFNVISRRSEIGLRRAIGATRRDIILQFVTESLVIAIAGGIVGITLGLLGALLIDLATSWHVAFNAWSAIIGFTAAITIGVIFGSYPAMQAASVSPVRSLRET